MADEKPESLPATSLEVRNLAAQVQTLRETVAEMIGRIRALEDGAKAPAPAPTPSPTKKQRRWA